MTPRQTNHRAISAAPAHAGPLSAVLTLATAAAAVVCIHLGSSGIQYERAGNDRIQTSPTATLEFAPLTDTIELEPARAPARNNAFF